MVLLECMAMEIAEKHMLWSIKQTGISSRKNKHGVAVGFSLLTIHGQHDIGRFSTRQYLWLSWQMIKNSSTGINITSWNKIVYIGLYTIHWELSYIHGWCSWIFSQRPTDRICNCVTCMLFNSIECIQSKHNLISYTCNNILISKLRSGIL